MLTGASLCIQVEFRILSIWHDVRIWSKKQAC